MSAYAQASWLRRALLLLALAPWQPALAQNQDTLPIDLRILIDISGAMRELYPQAQHLDAAAMLVGLLPPGSRAGIWTFGRFVNHPVTHARVDAAWRASAYEQLSGIRSVATEANLEEALAQATYDRAQPESDYRRVVLVLGADMPALPAANAWFAELRAQGYGVFSLAPAQQTGVYAALAQETDGYFIPIARAEQLYAGMLEIMQWLVPRNELGWQPSGFSLDAYVEQLQLVLLAPTDAELALVSPSGKRWSAAQRESGANWLPGEGFSLVELTDPELGRWRIEGAPAAGHIYVQGARGLRLSGLQQSYFTDQEWQLRLNTQASLDSDSMLTLAVEREGALVHSQPLLPAEAPSYILTVPGLESGSYRFSLKLETLDYSRLLQYQVQVRDLLQLRVESDRGGERAGDRDGLRYRLHVKPVGDRLDLGRSSLIATLTTADGEWEVRTVPLDEAQGEWLLELNGEGAGDYLVNLDFKGQSMAGREIQYQPKPLLFSTPRRQTQAAMAEESGASDIAAEQPAAIPPELSAVSGAGAGAGQKERAPLIPVMPDAVQRALLAGLLGMLLFMVVIWRYLSYRAQPLVNPTIDPSLPVLLPESVAEPVNLASGALAASLTLPARARKQETSAADAMPSPRGAEALAGAGSAEAREVATALAVEQLPEIAEEAPSDQLLFEEIELAAQWQELDIGAGFRKRRTDDNEPE